MTIEVPNRHRMPDTRRSLTHRFCFGNIHKGYVTVGFFEDGTPGELFIRMAKTGSTMSGLLDAVGIGVSLGLQHGVPLKVFCDKYKHSRFEPDGFNSEFGFCSSVLDYIFRWLEKKYVVIEEKKSD